MWGISLSDIEDLQCDPNITLIYENGIRKNYNSNNSLNDGAILVRCKPNKFFNDDMSLTRVDRLNYIPKINERIQKLIN